MKFWNRKDRGLEHDLESHRSTPQAELVSRIMGRVSRGHVTARSSRMKVGLAMSLTAIGLIVFAVFGGLGYASSAASKASKVVKVVQVSSSPSSVKVTSSAPLLSSLNGSTWICKWNGSTKPFTRLSVKDSALSNYGAAHGDVVPAPSDGSCPDPDVSNSHGSTEICKWNGSGLAYTYQVIDNSDLDKYRAVSGNIVPAPDAGCPAPGSGREGGKIKICQWKGYNLPYTEVSIDESEQDTYKAGAGNIVPKPASGCPTPGTGSGGAANGKTRICHATGTTANPTYQQLDIANSALAAHRAHAGDIIPMPSGGCPTPGNGDDNTTKICHWDNHSSSDGYVELEVKDSELNSYRAHSGDIVPKPKGGCPKSGHGDHGKTKLCHATGSDSNPYVEIEVDNSALNDPKGHESHDGDIIPEPAKGCPKGDGGGSGGGSCSGGGSGGSGSDSGSSDNSDGSDTSKGGKDSGSGSSKDDGSGGGSNGGNSAGGSQYGGCIPICHVTGSAANPYVLLLVPNSALAAHSAHGDIIPAPAAGCGGSNGGGSDSCNSSSSDGSGSHSSQLIQPGSSSKGSGSGDNSGDSSGDNCDDSGGHSSGH